MIDFFLTECFKSYSKIYRKKYLSEIIMDAEMHRLPKEDLINIMIFYIENDEVEILIEILKDAKKSSNYERLDMFPVLFSAIKEVDKISANKKDRAEYKKYLNERMMSIIDE